MNSEQVVIREMKEEERKAVIKVGRKAFEVIEALFIGKPKQAMVAEYEGKIVGGIIYEYLNAGQKKIAYIAEAFVDPDYHGFGIGGKLYQGTFQFLWKQGCDAITALVKNDNVGSWKLFLNNGFKRVSLPEIVRQLTPAGALRQYLQTPFCIAMGMDFYMVTREAEEKEKAKGLPQLLTFLVSNLLLLLPLWMQLFRKSRGEMLSVVLAYITILVLYILPRMMGPLLGGGKWHFRLNNGGSLLTLLLSIWSNTVPINANWYPEKYENAKEFRRMLAIPEICKWFIFCMLPFLTLTASPYLQAVAGFSRYYLFFSCIPLYPFESMGAGRIYRYSKVIWLVTAVIGWVEFFVIFQ